MSHLKQFPANNPGRQSGFTLAELLIVVVILGVLAAVAISFYQTWTIRTQVDEGLSLAKEIRPLVEEAFVANREAPADYLDTGMTDVDDPDYGDYVTSLEIVNGRIDITFGNLANTIISDTTLSLTPYETADGSIVWRCGQARPPEYTDQPLATLGTHGGGLAASYIPSSVPTHYLPESCK